jgi:ABC-type transport system involved in multi-copper enzyme maturation permease subunit
MGRWRDAMHRILFIALNTFRETIRNKILYVILAFSLLVIGLTLFLADLSVGDLARIVVDFGLASIHIFGVIMSIFLGITLVSQELDRKTVYVILAKPVRRWEFVVGKAMGLSLTLAITTAIMAMMLYFVHFGYRYGGSAESGIFVASAGIYLELVLLICLASMFSTFTTPVLSAIFTLAMFFIGHITNDLLVFGGQSKSPLVRHAAEAMFYLLPNLESFNWKNAVVYGEARALRPLLLSFGYFLSYSGGVLAMACLLFSRKDFK